MDSNSLLCRVKFPIAITSLDSPVDKLAVERYRRWIAEGQHAEMHYLERYDDVRSDPRLLLEGARSLIVVAFPYYTNEPINLPIARYARGRDYHEVVREYLTEIAAEIPGQSRICVDTAPLRERYWAQRAGLGFIGRNNQLIIPGLGSWFFLGFIITTAELTPTDSRTIGGCGDCRRCVDACPGKCLSADGHTLNANTCLSYLTIEHRGDLPDKIPTLYGCDVCQQVCPHNSNAQPTPIADFHPSPAMQQLSEADIASMTPEQFSTTFRHSAIKRTKLAGLQRNLSALIKNLKDFK